MRTYNASTPWFYACVVMGLAILSGCSLQRVGSDHGPGMKLCGLGPHFTWRPGFYATPEDPNAAYYEVSHHTRRTIECGLEKRGFILATPGTADFWIDYANCATIRPDVYDQDIEYEHGVIVLRVYDPSSRHMIWRGWAESRIDESASPEKRREVICKAVEAILDRFPYIPRYYVGEEIVVDGAVMEPAPESPTTMPAVPFD